MSTAIDLTGQKFTRLTAIKRVENRNGLVCWLCQCDCGKQSVVCSESLRAGKTKSCGCSHKEGARKGGLSQRGEKNIRYNPDRRIVGTNRVFNAYKQSARKRNIVFDLSFNEFSELISKPCFYCGTLPSNVATIGIVCKSHFVYGGIDRINSSVGYISTNVVPCCRICNISKTSLSQEEFMDWIEKIYNHTRNYERAVGFRCTPNGTKNEIILIKNLQDGIMNER